MDWYVILTTSFLLGFCLSSSSKVPLRTYHYINNEMTWYEAQQYCREKYTDLATIEDLDDTTTLKANFSYSWVWIGLHDEPGYWKTTMGNAPNSWRWSSTGETSKTGYQKWESGQPDYGYAQEICVILTKHGQWKDINCSLKQSFLCYTVTEKKKNLTYISTVETWNSAQQYCRKHFKDLAMIENEAENTEASDANQSTGGVWIGLYRIPWTWSDKSQSSFRNWHSSTNNYGGHQHCGLKNDQHQFADEDCHKKKAFVCHQVVRMTTTLRLTTITDADLTDPAIYTQMLQKLDAVLRHQRLTDFKLQWKIHPRKKDKEECANPECVTHLM